MKAVNPYLMFDGNAQEAFDFYKSVFGGEFFGVLKYSHFADTMNPSPEDADRVAHIAMPLGEQNMLMASDTAGGQRVTVGNNVQIMLAPESAQETRTVFEALCAGGKSSMPLQPTEWAELYGECTDKFGVHWIFSYTGDVQFTLG